MVVFVAARIGEHFSMSIGKTASLRGLIIAIAIFLVVDLPSSGCGPIASAAEPRAATSGTPATLYIINASGWTLIPQNLSVSENNRELASLARGHYKAVQIDPGAHLLKSSLAMADDVNLMAEPSRVYYVEIAYQPSAVAVLCRGNCVPSSAKRKHSA